jgi:hypothetical protein
MSEELFLLGIKSKLQIRMKCFLNIQEIQNPCIEIIISYEEEDVR